MKFLIDLKQLKKHIEFKTRRYFNCSWKGHENIQDYGNIKNFFLIKKKYLKV